jgi:large subunit ribosomal protein L10Ae
MEQDILKFIHDPRQAQFEFQGLPTSYLRLAAHRLAQHYFLQSIAMPDPSLPDGTSSRIILRKTSAECRLPAVRLADIPVNLPQEETSTVAAKVAIKQRPQKNHHGGAGAGANLSRGNLQKSVEERKEEYNKARARIFSTTSGGSDAPDGRPVEEVILPNTLHRSTSLELNSNTRYAQVSEPTLERSLTSTSSSSRSNRSRIDKEPPLNRGRQGNNNRVAIFRNRDSERKDPDYDRSYDRFAT